MKSILTEAEVQRALFQHVRIRAVRDMLVWHTPNGGSRHPIEAAKLKGLGTLAGIPDVMALHCGHLFGLELKRDHGGRITPAQQDCLAALERAGATCAVAHVCTRSNEQLEIVEMIKP